MQQDLSSLSSICGQLASTCDVDHRAVLRRPNPDADVLLRIWCRSVAITEEDVDLP